MKEKDLPVARKRELYKNGITLGIGIASINACFDFFHGDIFVEMKNFMPKTEFFCHLAFGAHIAGACRILAHENDTQPGCCFGRKMLCNALFDFFLNRERNGFTV